MPAGLLNPRDNTRAVSTRPVEVDSGTGDRRWWSDAMLTRVFAQDLNRLKAQILDAGDFFGVSDVEGDDSYLRQVIEAALVPDIAEATIRGRAAGAGSGPSEALTPAQVKTILDFVITSTALRIPKYSNTTGGLMQSGVSIGTQDTISGFAGLLTVKLTIADDAAASVTIPGHATSNGAIVALGSNASPSATVPVGIFYARSRGAVAAPVSLGFNDLTNVVFATGVLVGTTGADGKLTISANDNGNIYIENRLGSSRNYPLSVLTYTSV